MLPERKREIPMGEAGNLSLFSSTISISSHCECWLAHIGGGVEHLFSETPKNSICYLHLSSQIIMGYLPYILLNGIVQTQKCKTQRLDSVDFKS